MCWHPPTWSLFHSLTEEIRSLQYRLPPHQDRPSGRAALRSDPALSPGPGLWDCPQTLMRSLSPFSNSASQGSPARAWCLRMNPSCRVSSVGKKEVAPAAPSPTWTQRRHRYKAVLLVCREHQIPLALLAKQLLYRRWVNALIRRLPLLHRHLLLLLHGGIRSHKGLL